MSGINSLCYSVCAAGFSALWGLRVLPDKLWCSLGIACRNYPEFGITKLINNC